jgi:urea transporter
LGGPVLNAIAVALAFIDPRLSVVMFVVLGILYLLPTRRTLAVAQQARARRRPKR